jgi:hypothetical protein
MLAQRATTEAGTSQQNDKAIHCCRVIWQLVAAIEHLRVRCSSLVRPFSECQEALCGTEFLEMMTEPVVDK